MKTQMVKEKIFKNRNQIPLHNNLQEDASYSKENKIENAETNNISLDKGLNINTSQNIF